MGWKSVCPLLLVLLAGACQPTKPSVPHRTSTDIQDVSREAEARREHQQLKSTPRRFNRDSL